jgi:putative heme transporter
VAAKAHLTTRVRQFVAVALLAGALYAGWTHRHEIHQGLDRLNHPQWEWLVAACVAQAASMVIFARLQRWLLRCGGVRVRLRDMVEITLAGNALSTSLPGGAAWAAGWVWGQLRRRSVERVLAGWVVLVAGALSSFALFLLVAVGAEIAGGKGPVASLRWVTRALVFLALLIGAAVFALTRYESLQRRWAARSAASEGREGWVARAVRGVNHLGHEVRIVTPTPKAWAEAFALALGNWGADLATLVFCIWAVHASVPWRGVVVAYALTQISASIPITPGGLAVVEASLATLLVAYGMNTATAVTVVVLYRLISFWILVPIGWAAWGLLELNQRRSATRHHPWAVHRHPPAPALPVGVLEARDRPEPADPSPDALKTPVGTGSLLQSAGELFAGLSPLRGLEVVDRLKPGAPQGPERLLGTSDCESCDEATDGLPALSATASPRGSADRSGGGGGLEQGGHLG